MQELFLQGLWAMVKKYSHDHIRYADGGIENVSGDGFHIDDVGYKEVVQQVHWPGERKWREFDR